MKGTIIRLGGKCAGLHRGEHEFEIILRDTENHCYWLKLSNHRYTLCGIGLDDIAGIHQAQPDSTAYRGGDSAVSQLQLGIVNVRFVGQQRASILAYRSFLRIQCLTGNYILLG